MIGILFGRHQPGKIGTILIDAVLQESHDFENTVTTNPVETGADVTDHVVIQPDRLRLSGLVSRTPLRLNPILGVDLIPNIIDGVVALDGLEAMVAQTVKVDPVAAAFTELTRLREQAIPVEVVTRLKVYTDMVIQHLSIPRDATTGEALRFDLTLMQIRFASSETVSADVLKDVGQNAKDGASTAELGKQNTAPASEVQTAKSKSILYNLGTRTGKSVQATLKAAGL
jgi:hypothetical protein